MTHVEMDEFMAGHGFSWNSKKMSYENGAQVVSGEFAELMVQREAQLPEQTNKGHTHESDGLSYLSMPPQKKCKGCGEFYHD